VAGDEGAGPPPRRLALVLEYEGTRYGGSQYQKNAPSIQAELEAALTKLTGERLRVALAGRTDAGVHARGQVASFATGSQHEVDVFVRGLNHWLPADIAVRRAVEVRMAFDPRRHARSRHYRYTVHNARERSPLWRQQAWHVVVPLDVEAMRQAAASLPGQRDFAAFAGPLPDRRGSTIRTLYRCEVARCLPLITLDMEADAFLPHQVRRTVGALVEVGRGRQSPDEFEALLRAARPASAGPAAPAHGLCLMRVSYPDLDLLTTDYT
jgi:tRNA pseudouridine38-40 synthase